MTHSLEPNDRLLLSYLQSARCHLRLSEFVNENRDHDMTAEEVLARLDRLHDLGLVAPEYWRITDEGKQAIGHAPRFRALEPVDNAEAS